MNSSSRRDFFKKAITAGAVFAPLTVTFGESYQTAIDRAPKASAPADLKIESVTPAYIKGSMYVKITTNQGIIGYGEGVDAIPGTYYLVKSFGNRIKGRSPLSVNRIFEEIRKGGVFQGAQAGMYIAVLSAIE